MQKKCIAKKCFIFQINIRKNIKIYKIMSEKMTK